MKNIKNARANKAVSTPAVGQGNVETESDESEQETRPSTKKGTGSSWNYGKVRMGFLASLKEQGHKFVDAKALWDKSEEKRKLLSTLSLPELKRRKFVEKTCDVHPWV